MNIGSNLVLVVGCLTLCVISGCFSVGGETEIAIPADANDQSLTLLSEWGTGVYTDIARMGTTVYCAAGKTGIDVYDVSDRYQPRFVGTIDLTFTVKRIVVEGNLACATDGGHLALLELTNPEQPAIVYQAQGIVKNESLALAGTFLYAQTQTQHFTVFDVSNPSSPIIVGSLMEANNWQEMAVKDNRVYLTGHFHDLEIVDVGVPSSPRLVGSYNVFGVRASEGSFGIAVVGTNAYISVDDETPTFDGSRTGLAIINAADSGAPSLLRFFPGLTDPRRVVATDAPGNPCFVFTESGGFDIFVWSEQYPSDYPGWQGRYPAGQALAIDGFDGAVIDTARGLILVDIADFPPFTFSETGQGGTAEQVEISGTTVFLADGQSGMRVIDISDPESPRPIGQYAPDPGVYIERLKFSGNAVYCVARGRGLLSLDVSNPELPGLQGSAWFTGVNSYPYPGTIAIDLETNGTNAFMTYCNGEGCGRMNFDISDSGNPQLCGNSWYPERSAGGLAISGNMLCQTMDDLVAMYDRTTPCDPPFIASLFRDSWDIAAIGSILYIVGGDHQLTIWDISDPNSPVNLSQLDLDPGDDACIAVSEGLACIGRGFPGVDLVDVSDPRAPRLLGLTDTPGSVTSLAISGSYLVVSAGDNGKMLTYKINR